MGIAQFTALPVKDMILRYRTILAGFLNFYSFADNITRLRYIYYILHSSLQKTIQRKLDIGIPFKRVRKKIRIDGIDDHSQARWNFSSAGL